MKRCHGNSFCSDRGVRQIGGEGYNVPAYLDTMLPRSEEGDSGNQDWWKRGLTYFMT